MKELTRGAKVKLTDLTPATALEVGVGARSSGGQSYDVSVFGVDANGKLSDDRYFVFFNQPTTPDGTIQALGKQGEDVERFRIDLGRLPAVIQRLVVTITVDGAGTMSSLGQGRMRLVAQGREVASFRFTGSDFSVEKAVIVGELYRKEGIWRLAAVGQGFAGGLSALLKHFGGEEISPAPPPPPHQPPHRDDSSRVSLTKVTLEKKGEKKTVDLKKGSGAQPVHINLNWDNLNAGKRGWFGGGGAAPDLDLGCMYRMRNGELGVIQPIGGNFGSKSASPFILLDKDDRSGAAADGENLYVYRPDLIDMVMVFAFIYANARDFTEVDGRMTIRDQAGNEIYIRLNSPDRNLTFCAICTIRNIGDKIEIIKEERYFRGHPEADRHYGFGFSWRAGSK